MAFLKRESLFKHYEKWVTSARNLCFFHDFDFSLKRGSFENDFFHKEASFEVFSDISQDFFHQVFTFSIL